MSKLFQAIAYFNYWLEALDAHSLHSPFFYQFYTQAIKAKAKPDGAKQIEKLRATLLRDQSVIEVHDLGAGATFTKKNQRRICDIARTSLSPQKYSLLYYRIIQYAKLNNIIELGTSLGINTLYLANSKTNTIHTFEGSSLAASIARKQFDHLNTNNIHLIEGNIDDTFLPFLEKTKKVDVVLFDANHRYEPTCRYLEWALPYTHSQTILIFDDIYLNHEMGKAWKHVKEHPAITGTIDLFRCGIVFFDPILDHQHLVLAY